MTETAPPTPVEALEQILAGLGNVRGKTRDEWEAEITAIAERALGEHAAAQAREVAEPPPPDPAALRDLVLGDVAEHHRVGPAGHLAQLAEAAGHLDAIAARRGAGVSAATARRAAGVLERGAEAWAAADTVRARPIDSGPDDDPLEVARPVQQFLAIPPGFEDLYAGKFLEAAKALREEAG